MGRIDWMGWIDWLGLDGVDLMQLNRNSMRLYRSKIQMVFQDPFAVFNPFYQVDHLLEVPIRKFNPGLSKAARRKAMEEALEAVGLQPSEILGRYPHQLSGGQRQRVAIARSVAMKPEIILADEPTGNLDSENTHKISNLLFNYIEDENASLIMVTHDNNLANLTKRKITIKDGVISENK